VDFEGLAVGQHVHAGVFIDDDGFDDAAGLEFLQHDFGVVWGESRDGRKVADHHFWCFFGALVQCGALSGVEVRLPGGLDVGA
jgi:hypothetical protein